MASFETFKKFFPSDTRSHIDERADRVSVVHRSYWSPYCYARPAVSYLWHEARLEYKWCCVTFSGWWARCCYKQSSLMNFYELSSRQDVFRCALYPFRIKESLIFQTSVTLFPHVSVTVRECNSICATHTYIIA